MYHKMAVLLFPSTTGSIFRILRRSVSTFGGHVALSARIGTAGNRFRRMDNFW
jgi:hypothetical protein